MGDDNLLNRQPIRWEHNGNAHVLGVLRFEEELLFQAELEANAINRLEATRARVGDAAYQRQLAKLLEMTTTNAYAWGGYLCNRYLLTPEGMAHLAQLLMKKGQQAGGAPPPPIGDLVALARDGGGAWAKLADDVLRRDFPLLHAALQEAQSSEAPVTL